MIILEHDPRVDSPHDSDYFGVNMYFAINLRRNDNTNNIQDTATVLTIKLPYYANYVNDTIPVL